MLSSWAYHNHQPEQDFAYGVYTPYAKLSDRESGGYVSRSLLNLHPIIIGHGE